MMRVFAVPRSIAISWGKKLKRPIVYIEKIVKKINSGKGGGNNLNKQRETLYFSTIWQANVQKPPGQMQA
jgi:hypothetical protein